MRKETIIALLLLAPVLTGIIGLVMINFNMEIADFLNALGFSLSFGIKNVGMALAGIGSVGTALAGIAGYGFTKAYEDGKL